MSLDTFTELKTEFQKWYDASDVTSDDIDTFIRMAESAMFNNQVQTLKATADNTQSTLIMDSATPSRYLDLPVGYLSMRGLSLIDSGQRYELTYRTPEQMPVRNTIGAPTYYTITSRFEFDAEPDKDYSIEADYYKKFTPLSTSNATNSVLTDAPNIYLFGMLWAAKKRRGESQESAEYWQMFIGEVLGFNRLNTENRLPPATSMEYDGMIV